MPGLCAASGSGRAPPVMPHRSLYGLCYVPDLRAPKISPAILRACGPVLGLRKRKAPPPSTSSSSSLPERPPPLTLWPRARR